MYSRERGNNGTDMSNTCIMPVTDNYPPFES